jgi:hypothetical protein
MQDVLAALDNREMAIIIWSAVLLAFVVATSGVQSLASILRIILSRQILSVLITMVGYVSLIVFVAYRLGLWDFGMMKDTLVWLLGPALVLVFNSPEANWDPDYLRKTLLASVRVILVLEFVINFYVLPIYAELVLVPVLFCLGAILAVSKTKPKYAPVKRLLQYLLGAIGLSLLGYAVARAAGDAHSLASADTLRFLLLPAALTALFVPFLYGLAIYSGYENIFVRTKIWIIDTELASYTRRQVFNACRFRLSRVNTFTNDYAAKLPTLKSKSDASNLLAQFSRQLAEE